ncbi:MAG: response regulator [Bacteroidales bacterium]|nr:response regulator [Bacteroidales bacterium]
MKDKEITILKDELKACKGEIASLKAELDKYKKAGWKEYFDSFFDNSPLGIAIIDTNGRIESWNKNMQLLTGIDEKEAVGSNRIEILHLINRYNIGSPEKSKNIIEEFAAHINPEDPLTKSTKYKLSLHLPERGRVDLQNLLFSFNTSGGLKTGLIVYEITEQRVFEESIVLYKMIFENNLDGIAILDLDNKYITSNDAHAKIIGYSTDEILANNPSLFLGDKLFSEIYKVFDYQKVFEGEILAKSKSDSEIILDYVLFPVYSDNIQLGTVEIIRDISFRKNAEKQIISAMRKAEMADQLKTAFLSNMSHEIRTPMNSIIGFSSLLENPSISLEKRLKYTSFINKNGKSLLHIIDDILDIAKIESNQLRIKKSNGSLRELMNTVFITLTKMKEKDDDKNVELKNTFCECEDVKLYTDFHRLEQILLNLAYNGLKFTEQGFVELGYRINDAEKEILFYCKDTGIGIPEEKQEYIFERFKKIEESKSKIYTGAGLGLAISSQLVSLLGGKIWVESKENVGTTFYFTIPFIQIEDSKEKTSETISESGKYNWKNKKILIAEDNLFCYELLKEILSETNAEIFQAEDGKQAVNIIAETNNIDLVLMDIQLPGLNGLETTKLILEINPKIPIIIQSAYATLEDRNTALSAGCKEFLAKPLSRDLLFKSLKKYLG